MENVPYWVVDLALTEHEIAFIGGYLEAIDFTDTGDVDEPEKGDELTDSFLRSSIIDCLAFYNRAKVFIPHENDIKLRVRGESSILAQAGHDFWLTRNGHGAGFWDGDWPKYGKMFTEISELFGTADSEYATS